MTFGARLAAFTATYGTGAAALPAAVRRSVAQRVLDIAGIAVAATALPTSAAVLGQVAERGGAPQARAVGLAAPVPAADAALANGVLGHSLDFDDTHLPSVLHPSASVVPAALAVADQVGADGRATAAAIAVGLEVCVRVGMAGYDQATGTSLFFERGQHATSICGALGAAVSAACLYGLDDEGVLHALGIAASTASGIIESNRTGGTVKRLHCGWAAHSGVLAADLARRGITGPPTVLEGRFGLFQAFLGGRFDPAPLTDGLGERWEVPGIFFKPYPANHFTHAVIDAALALRAQGLRPAHVERARIGVAAPTVRTIGEPLAGKQAPRTGYEAQFSGPFAVTAGLFGGGGRGVGRQDFSDELARDPTRRDLMARVTVEADPRCDAIFPHQFPAVLTVSTRDGRELVEQVLANRGGDRWPLTDAELARKFADNVAGLLPDDQAGRVADAALDLSDLSSLDPLLGPLATTLRRV
jgi:2-methylcitrate dehydratase PrpD